jgi:putative aminopeptidase FrvX
MNNELLLQLSQTVAPSGAEGTLLQQLKKEIEPFVDEIHTDVLGNLIAWKKGTNPQSGRLMLTANMDERGIMVTHVEESGFLRFVPIGTIEPVRLIGERVRFTNGVKGIIGAEQTSGKDVTCTELFIDIGASNAEEALRTVAIGDSAVIEHTPPEIIGERIIGKSLDNRVGCVILTEIVKRIGVLDHDLYIVFSVQKEVGSRGIKTATYRIEPDFALVIGTAVTGDTPGTERSEVKLGKGPAIKVLDDTIVVPPEIRRKMKACAEACGIPYQMEVSPQGKSDAGAVHLTQGGIPTAALSVPLRYPYSPSQMVSLADMERTIELGIEVLKRALP